MRVMSIDPPNAPWYNYPRKYEGTFVMSLLVKNYTIGKTVVNDTGKTIGQYRIFSDNKIEGERETTLFFVNILDECVGYMDIEADMAQATGFISEWGVN